MLSRSEGITSHLLHSANTLAERPPVAPAFPPAPPEPPPSPPPQGTAPPNRSSTRAVPARVAERIGWVAVLAGAALLPALFGPATRPVAAAGAGLVVLGGGLLLALFVPALAALARRRGGTGPVTHAARVAGDAGAVLLGLAGSSTLASAPANGTGQLTVFAAVTAAGWLLAFGALGLYDPRKLVGGADELKLILQAVATGTVLTVLASFLLAVPTARTWVLTTCAAGLVAVVVVRLVQRRLLCSLRRAGVLTTRLLIVGAGREARDLWRTIAGKGSHLGFEVVGLVADGTPGTTPWAGAPPLLGPAGSVRDLAVAHRAEAILIAGGSVDTGTAERIYRDLQGLRVDLHLSTGLLGVATSRVAVQRFVDIPVLGLKRVELTGGQQAVKRAADILTAGAALLALSPLLLACVVAVRLSGPGPILFRQRRVGQGGKEFTVHKFRSMVVDAEQRLDALSARNESDGLLFKVADDPRITRAGRFLRAWSLDELPQLFDVLRGDMSIVGPRPPLPSEVARYDAWLRNRLRVKPGITGLWQVSGRHTLSFEDYVRYDLFYVENWSLALDLFISLRTIPAVLSRSGA